MENNVEGSKMIFRISSMVCPELDIRMRNSGRRSVRFRTSECAIPDIHMSISGHPDTWIQISECPEEEVQMSGHSKLAVWRAWVQII